MPLQDVPKQAKEAATKGLPDPKTTSGIINQEQSELGPNQLLSEHMNAAGDPVPDPTWGNKAKKPSDALDDDADLYTAMNAETADFD
ncbi:uncharacterized protein N7446_008417 [Penicillium canescens]|uniref:Uncharacterized protein n=1 Tax=Penicillium canescens TaxID=5083 RepID=A0AAD6INC1_PENCN|nr:uncharacterized protein N7446_008417 [Penicillium canescens]KAJ6033292.1 hypothetical protein N7444_011063 [Penicillium canescens]KAJ6057518.1 hypothetical protein N7460_000792 [Penicillium canescens]KAJ6058834.1 hypothetical protein N7446_008417 [Penicillium canescens]